MKIETKYDIGQLVILKTDPQKQERMVIAITINPHEVPIYTLGQADKDSRHYECEMELCNATNQKAGFKK